MYEEQLGEGEEYHKLTRVVAINLIDFNLYTQDNYRSCYRLMEEKSGEPYPDLLQIHFFEMPKFNRQEEEQAIDAYDRMAKWLRFLTNTDDSRWENMAKQDPVIGKAEVKKLEGNLSN